MSPHLSPTEAAERFALDPSSVMFPLGQFINQFGLTVDELRAECASGRLIARGKKTDYGFADVHFDGMAVLEWICDPNTPQKFKDYFDNGLKPRSKQ